MAPSTPTPAPAPAPAGPASTAKPSPGLGPGEAPSGNAVPNPNGSPLTAGTAADAAKSGFAGVQRQQQQQALPGHTIEPVPNAFSLKNDPAYSEYADPDRADATGYTVTDTKFFYGGVRFAKGDSIFLTAEEAKRLKAHIE